MVLDPETLELAPRAPALLERLGADGPYKLELPGLAAGDHRARSSASPRSSPRRCATARGAPPRGPRTGSACSPPPPCTRSRRSGGRAERASTATATPGRSTGRSRARQLVCALHVHVAVGDADTALAVYNAARSYLPLIAGARRQRRRSTPGRDSGPGLGPAEAVRAAAPPGRAAGARAAGRSWPPRTAGARAPERSSRRGRGGGSSGSHPAYGTLEFRVPDAQSDGGRRGGGRRRRAGAVAWLAARHDAGEPLPVAPTLADRGEPLVGVPPRR